jgi:hypothetical protein
MESGAILACLDGICKSNPLSPITFAIAPSFGALEFLGFAICSEKLIFTID